MDARYSRQLALPGFGAEAQQRLASARVLVVGAGGLGSTVIPALAAAGVGTIGIVDDDRVELSNLHRQFMHGARDVGRPKVTSAAETVAAIDPSTVIRPIDERLTASNALSIMAEYDLVVDGSDNFPTRYLVSDAAELSGTPLVWGSVSQYGGQTSVSLPGGPGYRDLFPTPPPPGSVLSCEVGGVLPTVVATIGSVMAGEAIKILTGVGTPLSGRVTVVDALTARFRELAFERDPSATPITGLINYEQFCGLGSELSPAELAARSDEFTLLDVREPWEVQLASLNGSVLIPLGQLAANLDAVDRERPVVVYCHHGIRSAHAVEFLTEAGFDARNLAGGIDAWARDRDPDMVRY